MNNDDINLVVTRNTGKKTKDRVFAVTLVVFVICFIVGAALMFYSLRLSSEASELGSSIEATKGRIASLSSQKQKMLVVNERLTSSRRIMTTRKDIDKKVSEILSYFPADIAIDRVTADDKAVSIGLFSPSLTDFDTLIDIEMPKIALDKEIGVNKITVISFTQETTGYQMSVEFAFKAVAATGAGVGAGDSGPPSSSINSMPVAR